MKTPAKTKRPRLNNFLLALDVYGKPFKFRMVHGYSSHRSVTGGLLSILLLIIMIAYSLSRVIVLINREDTNIRIWEYADYLDDTFVFNH